MSRGRVLRCERSRETLASALYELIGEASLEPTALLVERILDFIEP